MEEVIKACDSLYASVIKKIDFDLFNKIIKFDVILIEDGIEENHTLEIKDYESFLWVEKLKTTHEEYNFKNWDYYELTSISFGNIQIGSDDKWLKQYSLNYNIAIEIWESALLIRADKIIVDNLEYLLNTEQLE